jgi:hypothetical protein
VCHGIGELNYGDGMASHETPEMINYSRQVTAGAVVEGRFDPRGYPYRLLGVLAERGSAAQRMGAVLAAAEILEQQGWELVDVTEIGPGRAVFAIVRRR